MSNNKFKVLLVEDDAKIINLVSAVLEANDFSVYTANRCALGQTLFLSHNPDIVILDLGLPDRDGMYLLREVRYDCGTPFGVLSAVDVTGFPLTDTSGQYTRSNKLSSCLFWGFKPYKNPQE